MRLWFMEAGFCQICLKILSSSVPINIHPLGSLSAYLWQLMRFNILQLLKNLRYHSQGKEMTDVDILNWANKKVRDSGRASQMESFKVKRQIQSLP